MAMIVGDADANTGLAGAIFTKLKALTGAQASGLGSPMALFSNALAQAIIPYIQNNAAVTVTSVSGVTTGSGVSGPGTGTVG